MSVRSRTKNPGIEHDPLARDGVSLILSKYPRETLFFHSPSPQRWRVSLGESEVSFQDGRLLAFTPTAFYDFTHHFEREFPDNETLRRIG